VVPPGRAGIRPGPGMISGHGRQGARPVPRRHPRPRRAAAGAWLGRLPRRVEEFWARWDLVVDGPTSHGYAGIVVPVPAPAGPAVLKLSWPGPGDRARTPRTRHLGRPRGRAVAARRGHRRRPGAAAGTAARMPGPGCGRRGDGARGDRGAAPGTGRGPHRPGWHPARRRRFVPGGFRVGPGGRAVPRRVLDRALEWRVRPRTGSRVGPGPRRARPAVDAHAARPRRGRRPGRGRPGRRGVAGLVRGEPAAPRGPRAPPIRTRRCRTRRRRGRARAPGATTGGRSRRPARR